MTHAQNAILRYAYKQHKAGITKPALQYSKICDDLSDVKNALNCLQEGGYVEILSPAIGCAVIKLTDYGLSFCEQSF